MTMDGQTYTAMQRHNWWFNQTVGTPTADSFTSHTRVCDVLPDVQGPTPRAIVVGEIGDTLVMVAANGHVGGIYYFTVDRSGVHPQVSYQGFYRRGNAGLTWSDSYDNDNDDVGEPETKNIQYVENTERGPFEGGGWEGVLWVVVVVGLGVGLGGEWCGGSVWCGVDVW